jgi:pimeloyl-ACP methyl ester carboxylesterase
MRPTSFRAAEREERRTVVLLHSSASSSRQWSALAALLEARYSVHAIDMHGHGMQPAWRGGRPLTLADEIALVEPILREAGPVHIVGHSYGGAVALRIAESHPHSVRSLVLYEPVLFGWLLEDDVRSAEAREVLALSGAVGRQLMRGRDHAAAELFVNYWAGADEWQRLLPARQNAIAARMRAVHPHFNAACREPFSAARTGALRMPILYLTGEETVDSTSRIGALARRALPYAEHEILAGMGHMGPITHAAGFNRRLWSFLVGDQTMLGVDAMPRFAEAADAYARVGDAIVAQRAVGRKLVDVHA